MFEGNHISKEEFNQSKEEFEASQEQYELLVAALKSDSLYRLNTLSSMEDNVNRMKENLKVVQNRLDDLNVKAPVDGELANLNPEIGQIVTYGNRIGTVNVLDNYKQRVEIDEHYIARVRRELPGSFDFAGSNFKLKIAKVYPEVNNGRFAVDMVFTSEKPDQIRIGQTFRIKLELWGEVFVYSARFLTGAIINSIIISIISYFFVYFLVKLYRKKNYQWVYKVDKS